MVWGTSSVPLGTAVQRAVGLVALLVGLGIVVAPRMSVNRYDVAAAAVGVAVLGAAWVLLAGLSAGRLRIRDRSWDAAAALLCLVLGMVAGAFAYGGAYVTTWDPAVVEYASTLPPGPDLVGYFSLYPNVRPFLAVARTVRSWIAGTGVDYAAAFAVLNTLSFVVTAVAVHLTVRRVAGPARGVLALALLGALLGTTPWLSVPYTDMAVLWVPIVAVAVLAAAWRRRGPAGCAVLAVAGGAVLAVGYVVKVTPVVGLVALVLALGVAATGRPGGGGPDGAGGPSRRRLLVLGSCAVAAFLVTVPLLGLWVRAAEGLPPLQRDRAATPLAYVAAGLRTQTTAEGVTLYGSWDRDVVGQTQGRTAAVQNATARRLIREQWDRRGLAGTIGFAVDKTLFNWGDGSFWARGEGRDAAAPPLRHGDLADAVLAWNAPGGLLFRAHVLLAQVVWAATLLALGVGLLRSRYRPELLLMALTIAGIAAFTLLFQGRSRYLVGHVPVVVALAACVLPRPRLRLRRAEPAEVTGPATPAEVAEPAGSPTNPAARATTS